MTIWKITKNISSEGKPHVITDVQSLSEGQHQIKHADSMVPLEILPGEVIRLSPRNIKDEGMQVSFEHDKWVWPEVISMNVQLEEKQRLFWIWAPIENDVNVVVSVEKHDKPPRVGKER